MQIEFKPDNLENGYCGVATLIISYMKQELSERFWLCFIGVLDELLFLFR
jgi:hypothetical protein